jgi:hypothetical protein
VNSQSTPKTAISMGVKNDTNLFTINAPPDYPYVGYLRAGTIELIFTQDCSRR